MPQIVEEKNVQTQIHIFMILSHEKYKNVIR